MIRLISYLLIWFPLALIAQDDIPEGVPEDLSTQKIIFLQHEAIEVGSDEENEATKEYVISRQENHNRVLEEFNRELKLEAADYPFEYALSTPSTYESLWDAGYKYVFYSFVYEYKYLRSQPAEDELIVFGYYIKDRESKVIYKVFEIDEMKVYDAKLIIRKLNKMVKKQFPDAY